MQSQRDWRGRLIAGTVGIVISVAALMLASQGVDLHEVRHQLQNVPASGVLLMLALAWFGLGLRSLRYQRILSPVARLRWRECVSVLAIGYAGNNLLPARLGEAVRVWLLDRNYKVALGSGLGTLVVERFIDVVLVLSAFGVSLTLAPMPPEFHAVARGLMVFIGVVGTVLITLSFLGREWAERVQQVLPGRAGVLLGRVLGALADGLAVLRGSGLLAQVLVLSVVIWCNDILLCLGVLRMMGQPATLMWAALLVSTVALGMMVPGGPGYVGNVEFYITQVLGPLGVSHSAAFGVAIVYHFVMWANATFLGLACLLWELRRNPARQPAEAEAVPAINSVG
ncbi:MAG: lysylphosphatidylglycerol synthase transmembrane domain-containing protein [Candidatus Xenobia bacterium]